MRKFTWGVVGTGTIAHNFCADIAATQTMKVIAVCSRSQVNAEKFAHKIKAEHCYIHYSEMLQNPAIDAVYIATPNNTHLTYTTEAIAAGKPVLTEKPMALSAADIDKVIAASAQMSGFVMEAMWSRFLPAITALKKHIHTGAMGRIREVQADLSYYRQVSINSRFFNRNLGGGAAFDLGVYPLSLTIYLLGSPEQTRGHWVAAPTGCDMRSHFTLIYPEMKAQLSCGFDRNGDNRYLIIGSKAAIEIDAPFLKAQRLVIYSGKWQQFWLNSFINKSGFFRKILNRFNLPGRKTELYPFQGHGLQFQAKAVMDAVRLQQSQSQLMPLEETYAALAIIESVLSQPPVKGD